MHVRFHVVPEESTRFEKGRETFFGYFGGGGGWEGWSQMIRAKICLHMAFVSPVVNALNILLFYIQSCECS